ncbi:5-hydroxytryptamine receptor-like [Diprion similis]|uniref:5-hydroxytryptamine receptor-like n=1 Tax=Diprion similis TaxID=362088 RepID=UPI001EF8D7F6|nr:5-hydroxytryptamine receptor-like [Diprion similis]
MDSNLSTGGNASTTSTDNAASNLAAIFTAVVLGLMILTTVIGNVFVIAAIFLEKNLQSVANYLIVSLAVADLMVACLVMPLGAVYEGWLWERGPPLGDLRCPLPGEASTRRCTCRPNTTALDPREIGTAVCTAVSHFGRSPLPHFHVTVGSAAC